MFKEEGASSDDSMSEYGSDDDKVRHHSTENLIESATTSSVILTSPTVGGLADTDKGCCSDFSLAEVPVADDLESFIEAYRSVKDAFTISYLQERKKGIAHQLWPAAVILSKYIEENIQIVCGNSCPEDLCILELGAGIGLCGLVCTALKFRKVILTDLPVAIELLNTNINLNSGFSPEQPEYRTTSEPEILGNICAFAVIFMTHLWRDQYL